MLEKIIEEKLMKECASHGFTCLKFTSPARAGVPDRVVISPVGVVFVELKAPGQKLRKLQQAMHQKMRATGGIILTIDHPDLATKLVRKLDECVRFETPYSELYNELSSIFAD